MLQFENVSFMATYGIYAILIGQSQVGSTSLEISWAGIYGSEP